MSTSRIEKSEGGRWQLARTHFGVEKKKQGIIKLSESGEKIRFMMLGYMVCLTRHDLCECFHHNEEQDGRCYNLGEMDHSFLLRLLLGY